MVNKAYTLFPLAMESTVLHQIRWLCYFLDKSVAKIEIARGRLHLHSLYVRTSIFPTVVTLFFSGRHRQSPDSLELITLFVSLYRTRFCCRLDSETSQSDT